MNLVRIMAVRNEADILERNIDWYIRAGIPTIAVDNGSTDGSFEICLEARRSGAIISLDRIETDRFKWGALLERLSQLTEDLRPDAVLLASPDEFFEAADGGDLRAALEEDFAAGYNVIEFANMEFQMTAKDDLNDPNPLTRMRHYTFRPVSMPRGYRFFAGAPGLTGYGHHIAFPPGVDVRRSPRRYVSRHYPLRSEQQAREKIARLLRRDPSEPPAGRYLRIWLDPRSLYVKRSHLTRYREDHEWVYEEKDLRARLKATERALTSLFTACSSLPPARELHSSDAAVVEPLERIERLVGGFANHPPRDRAHGGGRSGRQ